MKLSFLIIFFLNVLSVNINLFLFEIFLKLFILKLFSFDLFLIIDLKNYIITISDVFDKNDNFFFVNTYCYYIYIV